MKSEEVKMQSMDQIRAAKAWAFVNSAKQNLGGDYDSYVKLAKGAPALIQTNGLMQTLAFYMQKKDNYYHLLTEQVMQWVWENVKGEKTNPEYKDFMDWLAQNTDVATYMMAVQEALEILKWIRQLAGTIK